MKTGQIGSKFHTTIFFFVFVESTATELNLSSLEPIELVGSFN